MQSLLKILFLTLGLAFVPLAQGAGDDEKGAGQQAGDTSQMPHEMVERNVEKMIAALQEEKENLEQNPGKVFELVDEIVLPHFDFERMAKLVLARHWRDASPEQRERFTKEFRSLLVRTYALSLAEYSDEKVEVKPTRGDLSSRRVTVPTEVKKPSDPKFSVPINYEMYKPDGNWKVYDVTVDGVSLVTNYRSSFSEEIGKNGLDALITSMAEKTEEALKPQGIKDKEAEIGGKAAGGS